MGFFKNKSVDAEESLVRLLFRLDDDLLNLNTKLEEKVNTINQSLVVIFRLLERLDPSVRVEEFYYKKNPGEDSGTQTKQ